MATRAVVEGGDMWTTGADTLLVSTVIGTPCIVLILVAELRSRARTAFIDPLTGLANRRGYYLAVDDMLRDSAADKAETLTVAVVAIDIDRFKEINDRRGHLGGDTVLMQLAHHLTQLASDCHVIARTGGDKFVCLYIGDARDLDRTVTRAHRDLLTDDPALPYTVSVRPRRQAVVTSDVDASLIDDLLHRADLEMYRAKHLRGRTRMLPSIRNHTQAITRLERSVAQGHDRRVAGR